MRSTVTALCPLAPRAAAVCAAVLMASTALGQLFSNPAPITIPDSGNATPYPSTIAVAGAPTVASGDIQVSLTGLSHTCVADVRMTLISPSGQGLVLFNQNGGCTTVAGMNLVFAPGGAAIPNPLVAGTYAPYGGSFGSFAGFNANGVWGLYVIDLTGGDSGSISGGWSITFGAAATATSSTAFTYQGRLTGGAANGLIDTRFTLWDDLASTAAARRLGGPVTVSSVALTSGLFTASVDFGVPIPSNRKTWLQIEVANPAGGAFVSLSPRQAMTFAPLPNVSSLPSGTVVGLTPPVGVAQNDASRIGTNVIFGTSAGCGPGDFNGMRVVVNPGALCGVSEDILFYTSECNVSCPREIMRINGAGNVGIGTDTPSEKLHVVGNILASGSITPSCAKLKENIEPMGDALDRLASLSAVRFDWKADEAKTRGFTHDLGFIAEDVAKVFPEVVFRDAKGEIMGLDYSRMSAVAVGAIKQLKAENDSLKARLERIEALLADQAAKSVAK